MRITWHGLIFLLAMSLTTNIDAQINVGSTGEDYTISLESREFLPGPLSSAGISTRMESLGNKHVLLQLYSIPSENEKSELERSGVKLLAYIPHYAWYAKLTALDTRAIPRIRYLSEIPYTDKLSSHILRNGIARKGIIDDTTIRVIVVFFADARPEEIDSLISQYGTGTRVYDSAWQMTLRKDRLFQLAGSDIVQWIENVSPDKKTFVDTIRARIHANEVQTAPYNLHGSGYTAAMWDAGSVFAHTDYWARTIEPDGAGDHEHPTMVAGIMAGNGSRSSLCGGSSLQWRGMATEATIISYDWNNAQAEHNQAINTYHAKVSQNSWSYDLCSLPSPQCDGYGYYDVTSREYDRIVRGLYGPKITVVGAAGNDGLCPYCDHPYQTVAGPIATSKNALSISGTYSNTDGLWEYTSRGPTDDGRIKPDLSAPACKTTAGIKTTYTDNCYNNSYCGTSFAAPTVSGSAILMYEQYNDYYGRDPFPSTIRAILYHTAQDLGNRGPDYTFGYGRIDIRRAIDLIRADAGTNAKIVEGELSQGQSDTFHVELTAGQETLKVTLVWDDKEASGGAGTKLVNNLNLVVTSPSGTPYYPWVLDWNSPSAPAATGIDSRNNMEQVVVSNAEHGYWTIRVTGTTVPFGPQSYTIVADFSQGCSYVVGDFNGTGDLNGIDVGALVNYFKGWPVPDSTDRCPPCSTLGLNMYYPGGDVNGSCTVDGMDVGYMVNYFKYGGIAFPPTPCPQCLPAGLNPPAPAMLPIKAPMLKGKGKAGVQE